MQSIIPQMSKSLFNNGRMTTESLTTRFTITHPLGLHLRVGKDMVTIANRYRATITAENLSRPSPVVDVKSILQLMQLQARQGHTLQLSANGPDAQEALLALVALFDAPGTTADAKDSRALS